MLIGGIRKTTMIHMEDADPTAPSEELTAAMRYLVNRLDSSEADNVTETEDLWNDLASWARIVRDSTETRDNIIRELRSRGASLRQIADVAGISYQTVDNIVKRGETQEG